MSTDKTKNSPRPAVAADTLGLLLFGSVIRAEEVMQAVKQALPDAVCSVDGLELPMPELTFELEGVKFSGGCMPMPHPAEVCDLASIAGGLFSAQEKERILAHKSFLVLSQEGGGRDLAAKRQVCRLFTQITAALMEREDAAGVFINAAGLLISRRVYLLHASDLKKYHDDPAYFPAPLWVGIVHAYSGEDPVVATMGLAQFGFYELAFVEPKSDWPEIYQNLYLMSILQITEQELYENMDAIEFTQGEISVFKEEGGVLYILNLGA